MWNNAAGEYAAIPGGYENEAGGAYSFAAGYGARVRDPNEVGGGDLDGDEGTFVWADSSSTSFESTGPNQFLIRAAGGVGIGTTAPSHPLEVGTDPNNGNGAHVTAGGVWTNGSDRNSKRGFEPVNARQILEKVVQLPVTQWQYKGEPDRVRHIGPTAQDFYAAFQLGNSDKHIGTIDTDGVALAAIQGLYVVVQEKDAEIAELRARLERLEGLLTNGVSTEGGAR